ncbi:hypothetical protein B0H12DRAFT_853224 [Mycena haematopus]|nr:hypothetical protein B0H12DRAFT_853224 [Mycena haematopus]
MPSATLDPGAPLDNTCVCPSTLTLASDIKNRPPAGWAHSSWALSLVGYCTASACCRLRCISLVLATLVLDSLHMALIIHVVYHYLITNYYNNAAMQVVVWSIAAEALPTGLTAMLVQSFYAFRVYRISDKTICITALILLLVGATAGCGIAWVVIALSEPHTYDRLRRISPLAVSINALSTSVDVIITFMLCYMLLRSQAKSLADETLLNRLILITINTGLLTSLCAVSALAAIVYSPNSLIYAGFYFCIGRLYSNALLASLNARSVIRGQIRDVDSNFLSSYYDGRSRTDLTAPADIVAATELAAYMERQADVYADEFYPPRKEFLQLEES